jgi:hypothetical protein
MTTVINPNKQLIYTLRQEIKILADLQRDSKSQERRIHLAAAHRLLNELKGKPNSHEYTKSHWGYAKFAQPRLMEQIRSRIEPLSGPLKLYCVVSTYSITSKLSVVQKSVQAAHALAEFVTQWKNHPRVKQWVETDKTLIFVSGSLRFNSPSAYQHCFSDCDLGPGTTACALMPMTDAEAEAEGLSKYPLLA